MVHKVSTEKCLYCDNDYEFMCLVEDDENPLKSHSEAVCSKHLENIKAGLIEKWHKQEWLEMDSL